MKRGFLNCQIKEDNPYSNKYYIFVQISDNQTSQGEINKSHFNNKKQLEVEILEEKDNQILVLLPEELEGKNILTIDLEYLEVA